MAEPVSDDKWARRSSYKPIETGYVDIPLLGYLVAIGAAAMPIQALSVAGRQDWIKIYIIVVALGIVLYNQTSLTRFLNWANAMLIEVQSAMKGT